MNIKLKIVLNFSIFLIITLIGKTISQHIPLTNNFQQTFTNNKYSLDNPTLKFLSEEKLYSEVKDNPFFIDGKTGFISYLNSFSPKECYNIYRNINGSSSVEVKLDGSLTKEEIVNLFKPILPGQISMGSLKLNAGLGLDSLLTEKSNTSTYYYYTKFTRTRYIKYEPMIEDILTESATKELENSKTNNDQNFLINCGDSLVSSIVEGGMVLIEVNINFETIEKKNNFEKFINLNLGSFTLLEKKIKDNFDNYGMKGKITITGKQLGGNSLLFDQMFNSERKSECSKAVDSKDKDSTEKSLKECTKYLEDITVYIKNNFSSQFTDQKASYYTFGFTKINIDDLDLPKEDEKYFSEINDKKKKISSFKKLNDYYLTKMNDIVNSYEFYGQFDNKFSSKFDELLKKLNVNDLNINKTLFGNFRFSDCWDHISLCTKENFDNAFLSLLNIFKEVDEIMVQIKNIWDYDLKLPSCGISLEGGQIQVRIYPLGYEKYAIKYIDSNLRNKKVFPNGWDWIEGKVSYFNIFEFQVDPKISLARAFVKPIGVKDSLKVRVTCGKSELDGVGEEKLNPFYFTS